MVYSPFPDMGWTGAALYLGGQSMLVIAPLTILLEAAILWRILRPKETEAVEYSFGHATVISTVMNIISGVIGFFITPVPAWYLLGKLGVTDFYGGTDEIIIGYFAITTAILCVLSIIVEGFIISVMALQTTARKVWLSSLLGNLASNLGLFLVLAGFILAS